MSDEADLSDFNVAILGLGLMGGSLALALRKKCASIIAVDPDPATIALAHKRKIVDYATLEPTEVFSRADLVILAAPVLTIIQLLEQLPDLHKGSCIVMDMGSTKVQVVAAMERLPERFDPVGGHPMCGKEKLSLVNADPNVFEGAAFAFTPLPRTTQRAKSVANSLAKEIGSNPLWLDPGMHDQWTAATSHFPYLVANCLANSTPLEVAPLIGPGFRSTARLAETQLSIMLDILISNQHNILECMKSFRETLDEMENLLARGDYARLQDFLAGGMTRYLDLTDPGRGVI